MTAVSTATREAETSVLGAIMLDNAALARVRPAGGPLLEATDFGVPSHRLIFAAMLALAAAEPPMPVDPITLALALEHRGQLVEAGTLDYLVKLDQTAATAVNVEYHADIVRAQSASRRVAELGTQLARTAAGDPADVDAAIAAARASLDAIAAGRATGGTFAHVAEHIHEALVDLDKRVAGKAGPKGRRIPVGLADLDGLLAGQRPGQVMVIGGRPGAGKTAFALMLAVRYAREGVGDVLISSLEAPAAEFVGRMLVAEARVDNRRFDSGRVSYDEMQRLQDAAVSLSRLPIYLSGDPGIRVDEIVAKVEAWPRPVAGVVVDYVQLVRARGRFDTREQEVSAVSRSFKRLAMLGGDEHPERHTRVVLAAQINRDSSKDAAGQRKARRPRAADLRESGALEQDADIIVLCHRDALTDPSADPTEAEIGVDKNRGGPCGWVKMRWLGQFGRFECATAAAWHGAEQQGMGV